MCDQECFWFCATRVALAL